MPYGRHAAPAINLFCRIPLINAIHPLLLNHCPLRALYHIAAACSFRLSRSRLLLPDHIFAPGIPALLSSVDNSIGDRSGRVPDFQLCTGLLPLDTARLGTICSIDSTSRLVRRGFPLILPGYFAGFSGAIFRILRRHSAFLSIALLLSAIILRSSLAFQPPTNLRAMAIRFIIINDNNFRYCFRVAVKYAPPASIYINSNLSG